MVHMFCFRRNWTKPRERLAYLPVRDGAQQMLQIAIEAEVADYVERHQALVDEQGHRLVVRNGRLPRRSLQTGLGPLEVHQPRVHDRRDNQRFRSCLLPPYLRRTRELEALLPWLYLKGVSSNDFPEAL